MVEKSFLVRKYVKKKAPSVRHYCWHMVVAPFVLLFSERFMLDVAANISVFDSHSLCDFYGLKLGTACSVNALRVLHKYTETRKDQGMSNTQQKLNAFHDRRYNFVFNSMILYSTG